MEEQAEGRRSPKHSGCQAGKEALSGKEHSSWDAPSSPQHCNLTMAECEKAARSLRVRRASRHSAPVTHGLPPLARVWAGPKSLHKGSAEECSRNPTSRRRLEHVSQSPNTTPSARTSAQLPPRETLPWGVFYRAMSLAPRLLGLARPSD